MKVYVAERHYDYEGYTVIGVFLTENEAIDCCAGDTHNDGKEYGDSHETTEYKVGENRNEQAHRTYKD